MSVQSRMPVTLMIACLGLVTSVQGLAASASDSTVPAVTAATAASAASKEPGLPVGGGSEFRARMLSWTAPSRAPELKAKTVIGASATAPLLISSPFGWRSDPIKGIRRRHSGIDLPGRSGTRIYATGAGIVSFAGWMRGYGNLVQIDHPGAVRTRYGHLSRILVSAGVPVAQGDLIGQWARQADQPAITSITRCGLAACPSIHWHISARRRQALMRRSGRPKPR